MTTTSTIHLPPPHPQIPIHVPSPSIHTSPLTAADLVSFVPFTTWLNTLNHSLSLQHTSPNHSFHSNPYTLTSITINSTTRFGDPETGRIGFLNLTASLTNSSNETLPGTALLRGPSVAMLIVLQPSDDGLRRGSSIGDDDGSSSEGSEKEKYVLLTVQARIPAGSLAMAELPAGMVDGETGEWRGVAAREVEEECGIRVGRGEMVDMSALALGLEGESEDGCSGGGISNDRDEEASTHEKLGKGIYPSPGGCDEFIPILLCQRRVEREKLMQMKGKLTGLREEGEKITLKLCRLEELWRVGARDAKALAALALYEGLRRDGRLPAMPILGEEEGNG